MIKKKYYHLPDIIGKGYKTFWNFKGRYRVVKGSRASKKSKTTALYYIWMMMKHPEANTLVVRKTFRTLKDSCFKELKWAVHRLGVDDLWNFTESPLEATCKPTGQKIYFRGLDDPLKVTSITVDVGCLCWMWLEEAYEIMTESDFDMLDESIRGAVPEGLFKQITITFNPWNERHWLKHRFFDVIIGKDSEGNNIYKDRLQHTGSVISEDGDTLAITTNYLCNEFLDDADKRVFERMRLNNPRRYAVAGLGNWGIVDGLVFENWIEQSFTLEEISGAKQRAGLDFGYTNDPTAIPWMFYDKQNNKLYVWDELYKTGLSNKAIWQNVCDMGYSRERYTGESAEPKSIDELKSYGMRIKGAKKGKDSVSNGIQWIQDLQIVIHPRCVNFLTEISNYTWDKDRFGKKLNTPIDDFNHLMDAMRYGMEDDIIGSTWLI